MRVEGRGGGKGRKNERRLRERGRRKTRERRRKGGEKMDEEEGGERGVVGRREYLCRKWSMRLGKSVLQRRVKGKGEEKRREGAICKKGR